MFTGGGNGPYYGLELEDGTPKSIEYIQAVLSYWLTERLLRNKTSVFRGAYYSHGKQFMSELPLRRIDFSSEREAAAHDKIVTLVRKLNDLTDKRAGTSTMTDRDLPTRSIDAAQKSLKEIVDGLYESTAELEGVLWA